MPLFWGHQHPIRRVGQMAGGCNSSSCPSVMCCCTSGSSSCYQEEFFSSAVVNNLLMPRMPSEFERHTLSFVRFHGLD